MTWTLAPEDRDKHARAASRRSARQSTGQVIYTRRFWDHAHQDSALSPGLFSTQAKRGPAREPGSPISRLDGWYARHEWWLSAVLGFAGIAMIGFVGAEFAMAVAEFLVEKF